MDMSIFHSIHTVLMFITFIGICVWAWSDKRKADFDEAANLPFADEPLEHIEHKEDKA